MPDPPVVTGGVAIEPNKDVMRGVAEVESKEHRAASDAKDDEGLG